MKHIGWRERLFKNSRGRILDLLRTRDRTVNDLAEELRLTDNAVRAHLASLERDRLVVHSGYEARLSNLTPHMPLARKPNTCFRRHTGDWSRFLCRCSHGRSNPEFARRNTCRSARPWPMNISPNCVAKRDSKELMLHSAFSKSWAARQLQGRRWETLYPWQRLPIAAATANHPEACLLAESLLTELIGSPVKQHCVRGPTPSCRFEVK